MTENRAIEPKRKWDRAGIKAEIERRGMTLIALAHRYGLYDCAISQALNGGSLRGAQAISDFLDVPVAELFPDKYRRRSGRDHKAGNSSATSQNRGARADTGEAA